MSESLTGSLRAGLDGRRRHPVLPVGTSTWSPSVRWTIGGLGIAALVVLLLVGSKLARDPARFPVSNVDVLGTLDYADRGELRRRVEHHLQQGFYGLDIDRMRATLESVPWVATASVSRVWPGRISVEVEEHEPMARWNDDSLISKRVELFKPPQLLPDSVRYGEWLGLFSSLPRLEGSDGRHEAVLDDYRNYTRELSPLGVQVDALIEDQRLSQTLELSNQVSVRLGYEDRERRFARFLDVYQRLVTPLDGRAAGFDMRYSNGFALSGVGDGLGLRGASDGENSVSLGEQL